MFKNRPLIALLTDFGTRDAYAAALKGVLLSACPRAAIVDVTHEIPPGNVLSASYALASVWDFFPPGIVFVAVVDPGVGTDRRALLAEGAGRRLVAPDNGIVSLCARLHPGLAVRELKTGFLTAPPSATFHGRDVFAPAAALIARGRVGRVRGPELKPVLLAAAFSRKSDERTVHGRVIHLDRFGNGITSVRAGEIKDPATAEIEFVARGKFVKEPYRVRLSGVSRTYADVPEGRPLAYIGSLGFLEIGVRNNSAVEKLGLRQNAPVRVKKAGADAS